MEFSYNRRKQMVYRLTVTNPIDRGVNLFLCCMQSEKHFLSQSTKTA